MLLFPGTRNNRQMREHKWQKKSKVPESFEDLWGQQSRIAEKNVGPQVAILGFLPSSPDGFPASGFDALSNL